MMFRLFTIGAAAGILIPSAGARAEPPPCKPSPGQFCFDLPEQSNSRRALKPQSFEQQQKPAAPLPNATHDRRLKLDDDTSFGLGGRGLGVKRSF